VIEPEYYAERDRRYEAGLVHCDELCDAMQEPETFEEYKLAYEHWRNHGDLSGCSHGC
jgi:hypothetical protein